MRKGNGELTYKQLSDENKRLKNALSKAEHELHAMTIAHNKLLKAALGEERGDA